MRAQHEELYQNWL
jgi:hypothetical protein